MPYSRYFAAPVNIEISLIVHHFRLIELVFIVKLKKHRSIVIVYNYFSGQIACLQQFVCMTMTCIIITG